MRRKYLKINNIFSYIGAIERIKVILDKNRNDVRNKRN